MKPLAISVTLILITLLWSCQSSTENNQAVENTREEENPAAEGFNFEGSDPEAIKIADNVMKAMGGRKNWDNTKYISWTFFNRRKLLWDRWKNKVRIETIGENPTIYLLDMNTMEGKVFKDSIEITQTDSLKKYLSRANSIWINDSYWLCMPLKLKDTGVTLTYLREDTTRNGMTAHVLGLSFKEVGDTPNNRYEVFVNKESNLVTQWKYYRYAEQDTANWTRYWDNYRKYGNLLLSGDRDEGGPGDIKVLETIPVEAFTSLDPVSI